MSENLWGVTIVDFPLYIALHIHMPPDLRPNINIYKTVRTIQMPPAISQQTSQQNTTRHPIYRYIRFVLFKVKATIVYTIILCILFAIDLLSTYIA